MHDGRPVSVLILYSHPLLGEGIARLLESEPGLSVSSVNSVDVEAAERLLALAPDVVIFERGEPDRAVQLLELVPDALVIDVGIDAGPAFTYHREKISAKFDVLLAAIRQLPRSRRRGRTASQEAPGVVVGS